MVGESLLSVAGNQVLVVNGGYRGLRATLEGIDINTYSASVKITQVQGGYTPDEVITSNITPVSTYSHRAI